MVATTGTQGIRYPQLADAPCDYDLHMRWLAEDVDAKITSHEADLARTLTAIPQMMLRLATPTLLTTTGSFTPRIPYDTVETQTGGLFARLSVNNTNFRFPRTGYYQVGLNYHMARYYDPDCDFASTNDNQWGFFFAKYPFTLEGNIRQMQHDNTPPSVCEPGITGEEGSVGGLVRVSSTADWYYWVLEGGVGFGVLGSTFEMLGARAYAFWVSDL